jgi:hypothetical protein
MVFLNRKYKYIYKIKNMENNKLIVDITGLSRYHENLKNNVLTTKQDVISDLETIRTGAAAGANASADAQAKADAAQAAAIAAAATDATNKADAAQAAAEATAAADATSKANAAQTAAEATASADATSKANAAESAAKSYADGLVKDEEGKSLFDAVGSAAAAQSAAEATAAGALDAYKTEAGFTYATKAEAENAFTAAQALLNLELPKKADVDDVNANTASINTLKGEGEGSVKKAAADAQAAAEATAAADATSKANAAQAAAEQKATDLNTAMNERVAKLEAIDHEKLALDASATAVAAIVAGAESDFDTLKEVADWINSDTTGAAALQIKVSENADAITDLTNDKQDVISDLETIRSGAAAGATAEATAKTYTDAEIVKVNATIEENERVTAESLTDLDTRVKDTYNKTEVDEMIGNVIVVASDDDIDNLFN